MQIASSACDMDFMIIMENYIEGEVRVHRPKIIDSSSA